MAPESARARKLIGLFAILGFLVAYAAVIATLADHVPKHWAAQLVFFVLAGTLWGAPLLPLFRWMNRGR
jgi:hypothetical protein